jgi:hypothetical protein
MPLLHVRSRPNLRRPVFIAAFGGWGDAGSAASGALTCLLEGTNTPPCAVLDGEASFDYTVERPITRRGDDGRWRLDYPRIAMYALERPDYEHDLLLMTGPEPHYNWPTLSRESAAFAREVGVELGLTLGAFIGAVTHRKTPLLRRTPNAGMDARLSALGMEDTPYSGPTAFVTAILHSLDEAGIAAASVWAAGPPYLGSPNPTLMLALLQGVERIIGESLHLGRLRGKSTDFLRRVEEALRENPEVAEKLGKMVELGEADAELLEQPSGPPELPSGQDLVEELERFLKLPRREGDEPRQA